MADLYAVLDVAPDASPEDIKRAYRRKAREHHPDAGGDAERFKEVTRAYEVLSDPVRRRRYDRTGDDGSPGARAAQDPFGFGTEGFGGIGDVIDAFFGASFGGSGARGSRGTRGDGGRHVLATIDLTLEDVATGVGRDLDVEVSRSCPTCEGSGSTSGGRPAVCATCAGAGAVRRTVRTAFGQMATAVTCPDCDGAGRVVADPCVDCRGEGRRVQARTVRVEVPPGVDDGDRLTLRGEGEAGRRGAAAGDLLVEVRVVEHPVFERAGRDLAAELVVALTSAVLGARVAATGLDGAELEVEVPPGTQPGDVLVVRRAGLPTRGGGRPGDLRLRVRVEVPTDLGDEERELVASWARLRGEPVDVPRAGRFGRLRDAFPR